MLPKLKKYPRTSHIEGSRPQQGDEDLELVRFRDLKGKHLIVEEKMDGANSAISFDETDGLLTQSRGHYLSGGPRERHFALLKSWAVAFAKALHEVLGTRYIMYGEWMYAKHTVYYNALPHYFLEFDVYDRQRDFFLSTPARRNLLAPLTNLVSVLVLKEGAFHKPAELTSLVGPSHFIHTGHLDELRDKAIALGLDPERTLQESAADAHMEGLYIKHEDEEKVLGRYKYVRPSFRNRILSGGSHWLDRTIIPNELKQGTDLFAPSQ